MDAAITIIGLIITGVVAHIIPKMVEDYQYKQYIKRRYKDSE